MKEVITEKQPAEKPESPKKLKQESPAEKKKRKLNDEYKKKYFDFYDDVKISDRQDW